MGVQTNMKACGNQCFRCNKTGHLACTCPQQPASLYTAIAHDRNQSKPQHQGLTRGSINGCPCELLLDTGTTHSMVHSDYVSDTDLLNEHISIHCAHGDTRSYPIAGVAVTIGGTTAITKAAVSPKLPQATLGCKANSPTDCSTVSMHPHLIAHLKQGIAPRPGTNDFVAGEGGRSVKDRPHSTTCPSPRSPYGWVMHVYPGSRPSCHLDHIPYCMHSSSSSSICI